MRKIIKNKNLVPVTIADLNLDDSPDLNSTDPVTSRGIATAISEAVGAASDALQEQIDDIANKADANKVVAIADATISKTDAAGGGWFKFCEGTIPSSTNNLNTTWRMFGGENIAKDSCDIFLACRKGSGGVNVYQKIAYYDVLNNSIFKFKVLVDTSGSTPKIELWINLTSQFTGASITELNSSSIYGTNEKSRWTYYSYVSGGLSAPVSDPDAGINVYDIETSLRQHSIQNPINNNFVCMDTNGNIKDSGRNTESYPQKNSVNIVDSGNLYNVFTDDNGGEIVEAPPQQVYVTGKFYFVAGKVCRCTAYSAESATFNVYGVVEAMNYILGQT